MSKEIAWKKSLLSSFSTAEAVAFVNHANATFAPFVTAVRSTLATRVVSSTMPEWNLEPATETVIVVNGDTAILAERLIRKERDVVLNTVPSAKLLTQGGVIHLNQVSARYSGVVYSTDLVLTVAQIAMLQQYQRMGSKRRVYCSLINRVTGATALLMRDDINVYVLQEDGVSVRSTHTPDFSRLTWFYNKRVRRNTNTITLPPAPKAIKTANSMSINRYGK